MADVVGAGRGRVGRRRGELKRSSPARDFGRFGVQHLEPDRAHGAIARAVYTRVLDHFLVGRDGKEVARVRLLGGHGECAGTVVLDSRHFPRHDGATNTRVVVRDEGIAAERPREIVEREARLLLVLNLDERLAAAPVARLVRERKHQARVADAVHAVLEHFLGRFDAASPVPHVLHEPARVVLGVGDADLRALVEKGALPRSGRKLLPSGWAFERRLRALEREHDVNFGIERVKVQHLHVVVAILGLDGASGLASDDHNARRHLCERLRLEQSGNRCAAGECDAGDLQSPAWRQRRQRDEPSQGPHSSAPCALPRAATSSGGMNFVTDFSFVYFWVKMDNENPRDPGIILSESRDQGTTNNSTSRQTSLCVPHRSEGRMASRLKVRHALPHTARWLLVALHFGFCARVHRFLG